MSVYGVPYSEHSSFPELRDCVARLRPKRVVPTVSSSAAMLSQLGDPKLAHVAQFTVKAACSELRDCVARLCPRHDVPTVSSLAFSCKGSGWGILSRGGGRILKLQA